MEQRNKYLVKYVIGDSPREGEFTAPVKMGGLILKGKIIEGFESIVQPGTKVKVLSMTFIGPVLSIE